MRNQTKNYNKKKHKRYNSTQNHKKKKKFEIKKLKRFNRPKNHHKKKLK